MDPRVDATWDRKVVGVVPLVKGIDHVPMGKAEALARKGIVLPRAVRATALAPMGIVPPIAVKATVLPRAVKATAPVPMGKAEALVPKGIVPPRVAKGTDHVLTGKAAALVQKVPRRVDASTEKKSGSNSTRTAMAASRRKKLRGG